VLKLFVFHQICTLPGGPTEYSGAVEHSYSTTGVVMSEKKVQCVPGGHQISLDEAYWCNRCDQYMCYKHARPSALVNTVKCPKGHEITRVK
jgi:hypothetical protein